MTYSGQDLVNGNLAVQVGTGDGIDTSPIAALDYSVGSSFSVLVAVSGVVQEPLVDYTASGQNLVFTTAPSDGAKVQVFFLGLKLDIGVPGDDTVGTVQLIDGGTTVAKLASDAVPYGKQTKWIPAKSMLATTTAGCSTLTSVETTAGNPDMQVLDFQDTTDESAEFNFAFPKSWDLGTITYQVYWAGTATTDAVVWSLAGVAISDNESIDTAYGTAISVTDNSQGAVEEVLVSDESAALTIAGTPADDDLCYFRITRDADNGSDTLTGDARLLGVKLFYTTDTNNDN